MADTISYRDVLKLLNTYVPGKPIEEVQKEYNLSRVIKLASNENPLGPSPNVTRTIAEKAALVSLYPDGSSNALRDRLSSFYGIPAGQIILGNGSDELLMLIALAYLKESDQVLVSEQTFSEYIFTATCMGSQIVRVPQRDFRYDLAAFGRNLTEAVKIVYLCNPNNPTGTIFTRNEFEQFMQTIPTSVLVVMDEAYYEYVNDPDYPQSLSYLERYPNLLILRTFSKIYGLAGLRIGYGIGSPEIIAALNRVREPFNVNAIAQHAALAALDDQPYLETVRKLNREAREYLYKQFETMGIEYLRSEANFVLLNTQKDAQELFMGMLKEGVIVRPMSGFGLPSHIRVTTGTMEETETFILTLKKCLGK